MALLEARVTSGPLVFSRPAPFPGCAKCLAFEVEWVGATTPGHPNHDPSGATDIVVMMSRHKDAEHGRPA